MKEVFKILKKLTIPIILCVVALVVQALLELSLPTYTSDIVDVGITQSGIKELSPKVIRKSEYDNLLLFISEEDQKIIHDNYSKITKDTTNYLDDYKILKDEDLYIINENISDSIKEKLNGIFSMPIMILYNIENNKIEGLDKNYLEYLSLLDTTTKDQVLTNVTSKFDNIDNSVLNQVITKYLKEEYKNVGIDTDDLQIKYILSSGLRMLSVALIIAIVSIVLGYLSAKISANFAKDLRSKVVNKVMNFSEKELKEFSIASLITRSTNDIQNIQAVLGMIVRSVVFAPIMGIGAFFKVLKSTGSMSWVVGIGIFCVVVIMMVLLIVVIPKTKTLQNLIDKLNLKGREILTGLPVIRTFSTEKTEEANFDKVNKKLTKTSLFVNRTMSLMGPLMSLIMNGMCILIIWVGAYKVNAGTIGVGSLLALVQYTIHVIFSFLVVAIMAITLPRTIVSIKRIAEILDKDISVKDKKKTRKFNDNVKGKIEFKNVTYTYHDAEVPTLSNISFTANKGETVAIIGSTGSGKSTLVNLIPRFYDVTSGEILIDDTNIKDVSQKELRDKIGFVPQKGVLFSGTIESNIKFASENITHEEVIEAARIAQAEEFITDKEDGYNSPISQGGKNVSGGQKQRLAIARAIASNPEIYVFDDSFSALDYKTDAKLRKDLSKQIKDATVIIVTQRVSTVLNANKVIVLDNGKLVGIGTHKELMKDCKVYQEIALSQLSKEELANE